MPRIPQVIQLKSALSIAMLAVCMVLLPFPATSVQAGEGISMLQSVRIGLEHSPAVLTERQALRISLSTLEDARARYDPTIALSSAYRKDAGTAPDGGDLHTVSSGLSVTQHLPSGITVAPAITINRTDKEGTAASSAAAAGMTITVPLFKGLGSSNLYRSNRNAAKLSLEAERRTLVDILESSTYATAGAYWSYVYAWRQRELARTLTESAESQLNATRALAEADAIATLMIEQASAYLQQSQASEASSELAIQQAWHGLMLAMGFDAAKYPVPQPPVDRFPVPGAGFKASLPGIDSLQAVAMRNRADLQARRLGSQAASTLLEGYRNERRPDISLSLWGGYTGSSDGDSFHDYLRSATGNIPGTSVSAGLTWTIDAGNRSAEAAYITRSAQLEETRILEAELDRSVKSTVTLAFAAVRNAADVYQLTRNSTGSYRRLKEGELRKFRMGMSDIFNLQTASNNLATAELQLLSAEQSFALAVLGLRRATGTLVAEEGGAATIQAANIFSVPLAKGGQR